MSHINQIYQHFLSHPVVCTDTRTISKDCLFFALKGENFDANTFAAKALEQGAAFAIIDNAAYQLDERCILVDDVLTCLQDLARYHRSWLSIPVIGLTGSNGKTTTKELINAVLAGKYKTFATKGNLNNHIGVPLSVLSIRQDTEIAVIEMGANHQREIAFLCDIAQPTHGLITNIGMAHLDGFGGFEGVKKGKSELFDYLKANDGTAFLNRDNALVFEMAKVRELKNAVYYGTSGDDLVTGSLLETDPVLTLEWKNDQEIYRIATHLTGSYNFENILAAITIGVHFDIDAGLVNEGLQGYMPSNNRSQLTKTDNNTVICDFYNANPSSMAAALKNLASLAAAHKAAIIGDMFELGAEAPQQHQEIAALAQECGIDTLILIGKDFNRYQNDYSGHFFISPAEADVWLKANPLKGYMVLLKGSRGMALEQLLPAL